MGSLEGATEVALRGRRSPAWSPECLPVLHDARSNERLRSHDGRRISSHDRFAIPLLLTSITLSPSTSATVRPEFTRYCPKVERFA